MTLWLSLLLVLCVTIILVTNGYDDLFKHFPIIAALSLPIVQQKRHVGTPRIA